MELGDFFSNFFNNLAGVGLQTWANSLRQRPDYTNLGSQLSGLTSFGNWNYSPQTTQAGRVGGTSGSGQAITSLPYPDPNQLAALPYSQVTPLGNTLASLGNSYSSGMGQWYNALANMNMAQILGEQKLAGLDKLLGIVDQKMPNAGQSAVNQLPYNSIKTNYGAGVRFA